MPDQLTYPRTRWLQLAAGIVAMVAVSNLQFGWTLFVEPLHDRFGWHKGSIQLAFSVFVFMETWLVPCAVYLSNRRNNTPTVSSLP